MTKAEINNRILKKQKELRKWENFKTKNGWPIFILEGVLALIFIIVGIVLLTNDDLFGIFFLILGIFFLIFDIVCGCIYGARKKKAPYMYDKVKEELDELNKQLQASASEAKQEKTNSNLDELLKYKKLLDAGVITQAEFDEKKKELL